MRLTYLLAATMLFVGCCGISNQSLELMKAEDFQTTVDGKATDLYTLTNGTLTIYTEGWRSRDAGYKFRCSRSIALDA